MATTTDIRAQEKALGHPRLFHDFSTITMEIFQP
jgi:hypothetical protein